MGLSNTISVLVFEQEPSAQVYLRGLLESERDIHLVSPPPRGELLQIISDLEPDAVFIDSELLNEISAVIEEGPAPFPLFVSTGATTRHALQAFELGAIDFLLKPFDGRRLQLTLGRLRAEVERQKREASLTIENLVEFVGMHLAKSQPAASSRRVPIQFGRRHRFIDVQDICYVAARGTYVTIKTATGGTLNASNSISVMERRLPPDLFIRVNRSAIINSLFIQEVVTGPRNRKVFLKDQTVFSVGSTFRGKFSRFLKAEGTFPIAANKSTPSFDHFLSFTSRPKPEPAGND